MKQTLEQVRHTNVKLLKYELGSSTTDLGKQVDLARSTISSILSGKTKISDEYARRIERGCGKPLGWLDSPQTVDNFVYSKEILLASINFIEENAVIRGLYNGLNVEAKADYLDRLLYIFEDEDVRTLPGALILKIMGVNNAAKNEDETEID